MASRFSAFECALIRGASDGANSRLGMVRGGVQQAQAPRRGRGQKLLAARHLQDIQMILDAQGGEEIPLDIQLAPEVGIGKGQRIASQDRGPDRLGSAEHQREGGLGLRAPLPALMVVPSHNRRVRRCG